LPYQAWCKAPPHLCGKVFENLIESNIQIFIEFVFAFCKLLSDIKNFSTLVRFGDSEALREIMGDYYRDARDVVWQHGGVFDKFVGDAIVAVWGYPPQPTRDAALAALRCAADVVALGQRLVALFEERHNEIVPSGTRVGIATGQLVPVNMAAEVGHVELSFLGNAINLAARLESRCKTDGVLIDHLTRQELRKTHRDVIDELGPAERTLKKGEAKGQKARIRAWQVSAVALESLRTDASD